MENETLQEGLREIGKCGKSGIDLKPYLERFSKNRASTRSFSYSLFSERRGDDGHFSEEFYDDARYRNVFYDAHYNFILAVRQFLVTKIPIAVIGFDVDLGNSTITIRQI